MNKKIKDYGVIAFTSILTIVILGCAGSQVPLSIPGDVPVNRQLIGIWIETDSIMQSDLDTMTIYQFNDYEYLIEYLPRDTKNTELLRLRAYTTTIEDLLFANVQCVECDDDNDYTLFRYELTDENILIIKPIRTELYEDPLFKSSQELLDFVSNRMNNKEIYDNESHFRKIE